MGNVGVIIQAYRYLFGKGHQIVYADSIPLDPLAFGGEVLKPHNKGDLVKHYKGMIYTVTNLRANSLAKLPLRVYMMKKSTEKSVFSQRTYDHPLMVTREVSKKRKDEIFAKAIPGSRLSGSADIEEVVKHPLANLLRDVNGYMNHFDLIHLTSTNLDLTGDCFWNLIRNALGVPAAIWIIPSAYMTIIPDKDNFIKAYKYNRGSVEIEYPPEDIVHFKYVTPASQFYGMGNLVAAEQAYNLREYMTNYESQMFRSGGLPKQILTTKNKVSKNDADTIKTKWKQTPAGDIVVMWGDEFTLQEPRYVTARDMGYEHGLSFTRDEIAGIFSIPKSMLTTDDVNMANAKAGKRQFAEQAIEPAAARVDEKITEQLAIQFDPNLFVMFDNPVPEDDEAARMDSELRMKYGITDRNYERRLLNIEESEEEGANQLLVPRNLVPISEISDNMDEEEAQFLAGRATEIARLRKP